MTKTVEIQFGWRGTPAEAFLLIAQGIPLNESKTDVTQGRLTYFDDDRRNMRVYFWDSEPESKGIVLPDINLFEENKDMYKSLDWNTTVTNAVTYPTVTSTGSYDNGYVYYTNPIPNNNWYTVSNTSPIRPLQPLVPLRFEQWDGDYNIEPTPAPVQAAPEKKEVEIKEVDLHPKRSIRLE